MGDTEEIPDVQKLGIQMSDSGGEVSMDIEQTNKLRAALGLNPLKSGLEQKPLSAEEKRILATRDEVAQREKDRETKAIAEKIQRAKEERELRKKLAAVKSLGDSDEEEGDAADWVEKTRQKEAKRKEMEKLKAEIKARQLALQDDDDEEDEDEEDATDTAHLRGLKVKHAASELLDGETVVLTLEDRGILNENGTDVADDADELVNVNIAEQRKRDKSRDAAKKPTAKHFVTSLEDLEKKDQILSKYDEEEEVEAMELDADGVAVDPKAKKQQEIRAKLAAAGKVQESLASALTRTADEYYTAEEMTAFNKPKKKKKKKLRTKDKGELMAHLEETAAGGGLMSREEKAVADASKKSDALKEARSRFDTALEKARGASEVLRGGDKTEDVGLEEEDDELYASLARARRVAQQESESSARLATLAASVAQRRAEAEAAAEAAGEAGADEAAAEADASLVLTDTQEFCRAVQEHHAAEPEASAGHGKGKAADDKLDVEQEEDAEEMDEDTPAAAAEAPAPPAETALPGEVKVNRGLASTLALLQHTGTLEDHKTFGGRTNDKKKGKLQRAWDESDVPKSDEYQFNFKLEREDEWGRRMTPKEAFREFCWKFHGMKPGKKAMEKRMRQAEEEKKLKSMETGDTPLNSMARIREATEASKTPYMVLSGNLHAGQNRDAYGVEEQEGPPTLSEEVLSGQTPLKGAAKVKFMMGIDKKGEGSGQPASKKSRLS